MYMNKGKLMQQKRREWGFRDLEMGPDSSKEAKTQRSKALSPRPLGADAEQGS